MPKEVYTNKDRMEHLISRQKQNNRVNCEGFVTRGRKPKFTKSNYRKPYNHFQNAEYFKLEFKRKDWKDKQRLQSHHFDANLSFWQSESR